MARRALVIVVCLLAGGCQASFLEARPLARGFAPTAGVLAPYDDGKLHLAAGRYGLAIERFGQALASDRRSLDALNGLAIAYARLGRFDVAQAYFERALEIDAFSALTLNNYGRALIEQGRLRDARPFLNLALHHAAQADVAVIAANVESMNSSQPPALIATLRESLPAPATDSRRLVRLAANRYRLETPGELQAWPAQAVVAHRPTAQEAVLEQPAAGLEAPHRPASVKKHAVEAQSTAPRNAIPPGPAAGSYGVVPVAAIGDPT
jgi:Tfp pilus assembly protein PilF